MSHLGSQAAPTASTLGANPGGEIQLQEATALYSSHPEPAPCWCHPANAMAPVSSGSALCHTRQKGRQGSVLNGLRKVPAVPPVRGHAHTHISSLGEVLQENTSSAPALRLVTGPVRGSCSVAAQPQLRPRQRPAAWHRGYANRSCLFPRGRREGAAGVRIVNSLRGAHRS